MDKKEKKKKKEKISLAINLGNGKYKDEEVNKLLDLVEKPEKYNGKTKKVTKTYTDFCSDGKYTRKSQTTYTLTSDKKGVRIKEQYKYHDDDGQSGGYDLEHTTGRDILKKLKLFGL